MKIVLCAIIFSCIIFLQSTFADGFYKRPTGMLGVPSLKNDLGVIPVGAFVSINKALYPSARELFRSIEWSFPMAAGINEIPLTIRMIKAEGEISSSKEVVIDRRLGNIRSQLSELPYASFVLLSSQQIRVPLKKKETVRLQGGQLLNVRILSANANKDRMTTWLQWLERDGTELLNTRMHIHINQPMLTGTDRPNNSARILALTIIQ